MKKIVQINSVSNTGSTGTITEKIGALAISHGWESYIAYGRASKSSQSTLLKIGNRIDHLFHVFLTRVFDLHGFGSYLATKKLIRRLKQLNPSIIHLHNIHGYYINTKVLFNYISKHNVPLVWTLHDCWPFTGHCAHFDHIGCNKWKSECNTCPSIRHYPKSIFYDGSRRNFKSKKELFNLPDKMVIVSVSNWLNAKIKQSFLSQKQIQTIYNGVNLNDFCFKPNDDLLDKYNLRNKYIILGVSSIWGRNKGLYDLIELSQCLESDEVMVMIGLTKEQIQELPGNIIGLEKTKSKEELAYWYSISDVYLNLSVEESFGLTTAEALACGTPVIVYDSTASPELVNNEVGRKVKKNDVQGVRNEVLALKKIGKDQLHEACIKHAQDLFDENKNYLQYIDLYDSMLEQNKSENRIEFESTSYS